MNAILSVVREKVVTVDSCGQPTEDDLDDVTFPYPVEIDPNLGEGDFYERTIKAMGWSHGDDLLDLFVYATRCHDAAAAGLEDPDLLDKVQHRQGSSGLFGTREHRFTGATTSKQRHGTYAKYPPEVRKMVIDLLDTGLTATETAARVFDRLGVRLDSRKVWNMGAAMVAGKLKTDDWHLVGKDAA